MRRAWTGYYSAALGVPRGLKGVNALNFAELVQIDTPLGRRRQPVPLLDNRCERGIDIGGLPS
jgi:hypothetical protein